MVWLRTLVRPDDTLRRVIEVIDAAELQIALVTDEQRRLLGTITDGDVRRGLLKGLTLEAKALEVMNASPTTAPAGTPVSAVETLMHRRSLRHIPILGADSVVVDLAMPQADPSKGRLPNQVVLMAGGLGTRLGALTEHTPKPLLMVGAKPILETILESFVAQGFYRFHVAVNYKADMIEAYFGDGSRWGVEIDYLRETKRLGTVGALGLLDAPPSETFFVMNGDVLTKINFRNMLAFHEENAQCATMAVREYDLQVPFGVVDLEGHTIKRLVEKPVQRFFVNAGVYVLSPDCCDLIPRNDYFDMTSLFQALIAQRQLAASFPIYEYWLDVGRTSDFKQAHLDYAQHWAVPLPVDSFERGS